MPVESADDLAGMFGADEHARMATYTPPGGGSITIAVMLDRPEERRAPAGNVEVVLAAITALVRRAELAAPANGATLVDDGVTYKVRSARVDETGALWRLGLVKSS